MYSAKLNGNEDNGMTIFAEGLTKKFGQQVAVQDVTFEVPHGKIFGFIGPSGSGKTTTIRLLTGVYRPTSGDALVLGDHPWDFTQAKRARIGYLPQLFVLYQDLTVWENLNFAASLYGVSLKRDRWLEQVLDFVELGGQEGKLARQLSGGMQRRLSLAATLVHKPKLLFLDEPTGGIDPVLRRKFWDHFKELQQQERTLFVTTQYVSEAAYCDVVAVLADGRVAAVDTPEGLRQRAYGGDIVRLRTLEPMSAEQVHLVQRLPFVRDRVKFTNGDRQALQLVVDDAKTAVPALLPWCKEHGMEVESVQEYLPPFDDVFVELVEEERNHA
jgi:ABC-2 type transport system ATP-binding protein